MRNIARQMTPAELRTRRDAAPVAPKTPLVRRVRAAKAERDEAQTEAYTDERHRRNSHRRGYYSRQQTCCARRSHAPFGSAIHSGRSRWIDVADGRGASG